MARTDGIVNFSLTARITHSRNILVIRPGSRAVAEIKTCSLGLITNGGAAMKSYLNDPAHWRERAEKTRAKAAWFWKDSEKPRMMRIADEYDRLDARRHRVV